MSNLNSLDMLLAQFEQWRVECTNKSARTSEHFSCHAKPVLDFVWLDIATLAHFDMDDVELIFRVSLHEIIY